jgi:hypothetical protein
MNLPRPVIVGSIFILCFGLNTQAGTLDNLESDATKPKPKSSGSSSSSSSSSSRSSGSYSNRSDQGGGLGADLAAGIAKFVFRVTAEVVGFGVTAMAKGGENSVVRYEHSNSALLDSENLLMPEGYNLVERDLYVPTPLFRKKGDPILPSVRLTSHWLQGSGNVNAMLNRVEAGYGLIGLSYSRNTLDEQGDTLTLENTLVHYRMSFGNDLSWDLAYGRGKMNGNQSHDGDVFAMPIRYRINPAWHFEYYPVWSSYNGGSLSEHQFSFNYHYKYTGVSIGHKRWSAGLTTVSGLFAGLYLSF